MKKAQSTILIILLVIIAIAIVVIAYALLSKPKVTGNVINQNEIEQNPFSIEGWKITSGYIQLAITNTGNNDYEIYEINIPTCGVGNGGIINKNEKDKIFNVVCNNYLVEGSPFNQQATIRYQITYQGIDKSIQTFMIYGNVLEKKCFYNVYEDSFLYSSGKCETGMDCIKNVENFIKYRNEERKFNNQPLITFNDVSVIGCQDA